jgi:hypothetical protein
LQRFCAARSSSSVYALLPHVLALLLLLGSAMEELRETTTGRHGSDSRVACRSNRGKSRSIMAGDSWQCDGYMVPSWLEQIHYGWKPWRRGREEGLGWPQQSWSGLVAAHPDEWGTRRAQGVGMSWGASGGRGAAEPYLRPPLCTDRTAEEDKRRGRKNCRLVSEFVRDQNAKGTETCDEKSDEEEQRTDWRRNRDYQLTMLKFLAQVEFIRIT